jgi:Ca-activated chloride channel family protein
MKNNILACAHWILAAALGMVSSLPGNQQQPVIRVKVPLVEVYASVYDHNGQYVEGLARDSFRVFEDGKTQQIMDFEADSGKLSCAILLDTTGSMNEALPHVKNSIVKLIDVLGPEDAVAIFTFDRRLVVRQEFTTDKAAAKRAVLRTRAEGQTALFDALSEVVQEISERPGKKALVVFSDGDDNASVLNANSAVTRAQKAGIPLYAIAEGEATRSRELRRLLDDLSKRTGGASYQAKKPSEIEEVFQKIAIDLRHLYMLTYRPEVASEGGRWRKVEVVLTGPKDFRVRAKEGYFPE